MVSETAFDEDPLRVLRLARFACELDLHPDAETTAAAAARAPRLGEVAAERTFAELRRVVQAPAALDGLALMDRLGVTAAILPELAQLRDVRQNRFHHLDVLDHTLAVLQAVIDLHADPEPLVGADHAQAVARLLAEPFADDLDRGGALRLGALLHDIAKPQTQRMNADGTVLGFPGHDALGADVAREILTRLRTSEKLRAHVAGLAHHHLHAGFLVHHQPLTARKVHDYLERCGPVAVDVTLLSLADRVATRGDNAGPAIEGHLAVGRLLLGAALEREAQGAPAPLLRGDDLAAELQLEHGPQLGALLAELAAARYAGEIATREDAIAHARAWLQGVRSARVPRTWPIPTASSARSSPARSRPRRSTRTSDARVHGHQPGDARPRAGDPASNHSQPTCWRSMRDDLARRDVAAQRLAARAKDKLGADGVNLLNSCGSGRLADRLPLPHARDPALRATTRCACRGSPGPGDEDEIAAAAAP
jgi:putative nucleotidyltransferase with HDIG domain